MLRLTRESEGKKQNLAGNTASRVGWDVLSGIRFETWIIEIGERSDLVLRSLGKFEIVRSLK
ncbi:hypothetical protein N7471_013860 [Penicillium samsonianum]|uniref:uncharacterized protein n=1 Tax=Penicillium samsonianum TaxID=1882272 RepID=UPI002548FD0E|nr:uncharacterized protein N7471_013860 [Penicillium samsonianum]KAJ6118393.1 hypothetical protein N7471_013860 [Penicillium samsonianum]